jgi:hypothetical protein
LDDDIGAVGSHRFVELFDDETPEIDLICDACCAELVLLSCNRVDSLQTWKPPQEITHALSIKNTYRAPAGY